MQEGMEFLEDGAIEFFCYAIVLGSVMNSEFLFDTLLIQKCNKLLPSVLAAMVRVKYLVSMWA